MTMTMRTRFACMLLAFIAVFCTVITAVQTPVFAGVESITYSGVLDDLQNDKSFSADNYPIKADDYSLQIIQLAESVNKELFVYVYQPSGDKVKASSINISTTINDEISYYNYKLELLNFNKTIFKYKVADFEIKTDPVRYYAISSVYRPYNADIDDNKSGNNTINEVNYAVNKQYCFGEINGKPYVNCVDIETIVVTDKFVGFVRYKDGFKLYVGACDSHFVAFNTDKPIDKLLEADVYYTTQPYSWLFAIGIGERETFGDKQDNYAYLKYTDKVEHSGGGLFAGTYKWDRIQSVEDFVKGENRENIYYGAILNVKVSTKLTDEALSELKDKKWVLRFTETVYTLNSGGNGSTSERSTLVGDVTILRLKFETDGITYNLGVIDNKQTESRVPSNSTSTSVGINDIPHIGKGIPYILMLALLLLLLVPLLPYIIKLILWLISLPFKGVSKLNTYLKRRRIERKVSKEYKSQWDKYIDDE